MTPCVVPTPAATICLGADGGSMAATGAHGTTETLVLNVRNPGATSSTPVAVLLWVEGGGALPFGQPVCTACNSTAGRSVVGLEWPALAPGETRALLVRLPVSAGTGIVTWSATLYARSLADVLTDEIANGVQPGQATWKVALTVTGS